MSDNYLQGFNLVGGTALSLYMGHRLSVDLDLFTKETFNVEELRKHLVKAYGFKERYIEKNTLKGEINGVMIDCIRHDYPNISPVTYLDNIRLLSLEDLLAMKLQAITDSGDREKDFVDIAFFSTKVSLNDMLHFYSTKYEGSSILPPQKALLYFDDIIRNEPLILTHGKYKWELVEQRIREMENSPGKIFTDMPVELNPKIERLEKETAGYAIEYMTGRGLHSGFPWLRNSFQTLCEEIIKDSKAGEKFSGLLRNCAAQRIMELCGNSISEEQRIKLSPVLQKIATIKSSNRISR